MSETSPSPRRVRTPGWLDTRLVIGVVLVLAAVLLGAKVVSGAQHTERRLALAHALAAGAIVQAGDLTRVDVRLPGGSEVYAADPDAVIGHRLNRPLDKGELIPTSALGVSGPTTTISVPLAARSAPELRRGQRIEIWLSTPTCRSVVLLPDVTVQAVHVGSDVIGAGSGQDIVLSISAPLAARVVAALADKDAVIRAGVLGGGLAVEAGAELPSLSSCLGAST